MMVHRQGDWIAARAGDEIVMMSLQLGRYLGMSEVGARIWDLIETPQTVGAIQAQLLAEYEVDEATCAAEVQAFLAELAENNAVRVEA